MVLAASWAEVVTAAGLGVAGVFALYKFVSAERLRRTREIPSVDGGSMVATGYPIDNEKAWVQLSITWRNPGKDPFQVDTKQTRVDVFEIPRTVSEGPLSLRRKETDLGEPKYTCKPYEGATSLQYEPGTETVVQTHFVLARDSVVVFRWKLYRANPKNRKLSRIRFLVFNPATLQTTNAPDLAESSKLQVEEPA